MHDCIIPFGLAVSSHPAAKTKGRLSNCLLLIYEEVLWGCDDRASFSARSTSLYNSNPKQSRLWPPSTLSDVIADAVVLSPGPYLTHYTFFKESVIKKRCKKFRNDWKLPPKSLVGRGKDQPKRQITGCYIVSLMDTQLFAMYPPGTCSQGLGIE